MPVIVTAPQVLDSDIHEARTIGMINTSPVKEVPVVHPVIDNDDVKEVVEERSRGE